MEVTYYQSIGRARVGVLDPLLQEVAREQMKRAAEELERRAPERAQLARERLRRQIAPSFGSGHLARRSNQRRVVSDDLGDRVALAHGAIVPRRGLRVESRPP